MKPNSSSCCFFLLSLMCNCVFAQTTIKGKIIDEKGVALPNANITLTVPGKPVILTYAISDSNGSYTLNPNTVLDSLQINVSFIGFGSEKKIIKNTSQTVNFGLLESAVELKEVFLKTAPVTQSGDTITYTIGAFQNQKDRVIADVLRKLPGIEVESDGSILYQGKPIQKYYIESLDLLEGRYNLANNNLPADAVSKVQILENHQPVKILDSLVFSDRASLNIKLKNKITTTGLAKTGLGIAPFLWDINSTPMLFTKKQQMILSYQANNTGNDAAKELKILTIEELLSRLESNSGKQDWLGIQQLSPPPFSEDRWLDNNVHLITINYLLRLKQDYNLKVNISYVNDYQKQMGNTQTTIFTTTDTINLPENKNNKLFFSSLQSKFSLIKNTKQSYLKNDMEINGYWDAQQGFINGTEPDILQQVQNPFSSFSNRLRWILPIGKKLTTINSVITYTRAPQELLVFPGVFQEVLNGNNPYDKTVQKTNAANFYTNNYISFTKGFKQFTITPKIGFLWQCQSLESRINTTTGSSQNTLSGIFQNNLDYFKANGYITINTEYKYNSGSIALITPLKFQSFTVNDKNLNEKQELNLFTFEPGLFSTHEINLFWKITFSASLSNAFGSIEQLYYGFIVNNYRNVQRYNAPIAKRLNQSYKLRLFYRNPLKSFFANTFYAFNHTKHNLLFSNVFDENGVMVLEATAQDNTSKTHTITLKASNYFSKIKTTLSIGSTLSSVFNTQLLNNELTDVKTQSLKLNFKLISEITGWLGLEYNNKRAFFSAKLENRALDHIQTQEHIVNINIYPNENQYIGVNTEYYTNNFSTENQTNSFLNLTYRYTFLKSKMDLEAKWTNLLNTKQFTYVFNNDFSYIQNTYTLRPSQVLLSLKFRL